MSGAPRSGESLRDEALPGLDATVADLVASLRASGDCPAAAEALYLAGLSRAVGGDHGAALQLYEASLAENPLSGAGAVPRTAGRALVGLAEIRAHILRDYGAALDLLSPLLEARPVTEITHLARLETAFVHTQRGLLVSAEHGIRQVLAESDLDAVVRARAFQYLGLVLARQSDRTALGEAVKALSQAAELVAGQPRLLSQIHDSLGRIHSRLGNYQGALRWFGESLAAKEATGDREGVAITHGGMAEAHLRAGDFAAAAASYRQDLELVEGWQPANAALVSQLRCNLCECSRQTGDPGQAEVHLAEASRVAAQLAPEQRRLCESYITWHQGRLLAGAGDPELAIERYRQAEEAFTALGHTAPLATLSRDLGESHLRLMDLPAAQRALEWAERHEADPYEQQFLFRDLTELAQAQGRQADLQRYAARAWYLAGRYRQGTVTRALEALSGPQLGLSIRLADSPPSHLAPRGAAQLRLTLLDAWGKPLAGEFVEFSSAALLSLGGHIEPASLTTDARGCAEAAVLAGDREGRVTLEICVPSGLLKEEVSFSVFAGDQA